MDELESSLRKLVEAIGVSGHEEPIRETIRGMLPNDIETKVDSIGNLIATIGKAEPHVVFLAHMDELGYLVTNIEDNGFVRLRKIGSLDDRYMPGKIFQVHTSKGPVEGVIGLTPPHLTLDPELFKKVLQYHEVFLDLGTRSKDETLALGVMPLDPVTLRKELRVINEVYFCCRSIDDRFGCLALVEVLKRLNGNRPDRKLTFVWTVQEETGLGGARVIANTMKVDKAIAVDSYPSGDAPLTQFHLAPNRLGEGPVLRVVDYGATANPTMVERVKKIAKKHGIPLGAGPTGGYTDGVALQEKGVPMVPVTIPIRYMHSPVEMCHRKDLENLIELLTFVAAEI